MSVQELLAPYLNRFVFLHQLNASAKLELICEQGKLTVNIKHELGEVEQASLHVTSKAPLYKNVLKKNVPISQFNRLQKRAIARAEEAIKETKKQQEFDKEANNMLHKAINEAE